MGNNGSQVDKENQAGQVKLHNNAAFIKQIDNLCYGEVKILQDKQSNQYWAVKQRVVEDADSYKVLLREFEKKK